MWLPLNSELLSDQPHCMVLHKPFHAPIGKLWAEKISLVENVQSNYRK